MSEVKELTKKITEEQLKTVQDQQGKLQEALRTLGVLDVQKQNVHGQIAELSKVIEATKKELEEEYGQVNINLQDGTYEDIVEEDEK
jgi:flagellar biosynthesis chaperone FliJ